MGVALLVASTQVGATVIANGSFESPGVADGLTPNAFNSATPTSWAGGLGIFNGTVNPSVWPTANAGVQFVDIGNQSTTALSQTVTISTSGEYLLSWFDETGEAAGLNTSPYRVEILDAASAVVATVDLDAYLGGLNNWQHRSLSASLGAGSYSVRFSSLGTTGGGLDTLLDDVTLEPVSAPEPGTLVLVVLGACGGWLAHRKRSRRHPMAAARRTGTA